MKLSISPSCLAAALSAALLFVHPLPLVAADVSSQVRHVIDGDTVVLSDGRKVRYVGVDAPEAGEPHYNEAKALNYRLVNGRPLSVEVCREEPRDRHARTLAWLWAGDVLVNRELLSAGLARTLVILPCGSRFQKDFAAAEAAAKESGRGLWSGREPETPVVAVSDAKAHVGRAVIVEGMVEKIDAGKSAVFLRMGVKDKAPFTAVIPKRVLRGITGAPASLKGKGVRVRGVVTEHKGIPEMFVAGAADIEASPLQ